MVLDKIVRDKVTEVVPTYRSIVARLIETFSALCETNIRSCYARYAHYRRLIIALVRYSTTRDSVLTGFAAKQMLPSMLE